MDYSVNHQSIMKSIQSIQGSTQPVTNLATGAIDTEYIIKEIRAEDEELKDFLFTLGCYEGETITIISVLAENYVVSVKDARYSIDVELAKAIII